MTFDDIVILIKPYEREKDDMANTKLVIDLDSCNQALCHIRDIGREEFYLARSSKTYRPILVVTMRKNHYQGEEYLFFGKSMDLKTNINEFLDKGGLYKAVRTYTPGQAVLGRFEKKYIGVYKPSTDDVEIVVEEIRGTPLTEVKKKLREALWSEDAEEY